MDIFHSLTLFVVKRYIKAIQRYILILNAFSCKYLLQTYISAFLWSCLNVPEGSHFILYKESWESEIESIIVMDELPSLRLKLKKETNRKYEENCKFIVDPIFVFRKRRPLAGSPSPAWTPAQDMTLRSLQWSMSSWPKMISN